MKIKKVVIINWANLDNDEYSFDDLMFLTGETGVGKSTLLDAVQTIMTASKRGLVKYNAGQDESANLKRDKEYRTLGGYVLGEDRGKFSRPDGCTSSIALTFSSTKEEEPKVFSAIVNCNYVLETSSESRKPVQNKLSFFIVNDEVHLDTLVETKDEDKKVLLADKLYQKLIRTFGKENVFETRTKENYLNVLYGNFWGSSRTTTLRSTKAAKAFVNFIHAKPVDDINKFIRNEFLEPKEMKEQIKKLSSAIRSLNNLKQKADEIAEVISLRENLRDRISRITNNWYENKKESYKYKRYRFLKEKHLLEKNKNEISKDEKKILTLEKQAKTLRRKIDDSQTKINDKNKMLANNGSFLAVQEIEETKKIYKSNYFKERKRLLDFTRTILQEIKPEIAKCEHSTDNTIKEVIKNFENFKFLVDDFNKTEPSKFFYVDVDEDNYLETYEKLLKDIEEVVEELKKIDEVFTRETFMDFYEKGRLDNLSKANDLEERQERLETQISNISKNKIYCPEYIETSFQKLKLLIPESNMSMLYEYVEITDEKWRNSIEGFMGNSRFNILIEEEYEEHAIRLVREKKLSLKIIQGSKALKDTSKLGKNVDDNSIINEMKITNEVIECYLIRQYGNVLCVEDEQTLRYTRRGITPYGSAANAGAMFNCSLKDGKYVFGEKAFELTLETLKIELLDIKDSLPKIKLIETDYRDTTKLLNKISTLNNSVKEDDISTISQTLYNYFQTKERIQSIDMQSFENMKEEIELLEEEKKNQEDDLKKKEKEHTTLKTLLGLKTEEILKTESDISKVENESKIQSDSFREIHLLSKSNSDFKEVQLEIEGDINLDAKYLEPKTLKEHIFESWNYFSNLYENEELLNYAEMPLEINLGLKELNGLNGQFASFMKEKEIINHQIDMLKNKVEFKHREEILKAEKKIKDIFVDDFCSTIYRNINNGKNVIDTFSKTLEEHTFGNEQYFIDIKPADKELEEYKKYFKYISENKGLIGNDVLDLGYSDEFDNIRKKLFNLLMENEKHESELARISDYRNFAKYDIFQVVDGLQLSLSKNGKNSGGQGETSYYIVRSINLMSSFRPTEAISNGYSLQTIIIDESFLKINEKRAKEILHYLNKELGFQVIAAMPTRSQASLRGIGGSKYHITKHLIGDSVKNGEVNYKTWTRYIKENEDETKFLFEEKNKQLLEEAQNEGLLKYAE